MHDRRGEIRGRLRRIVDQHLRPAERRHVTDLTVQAWHVPPAPDGTIGEPVPFTHARAQQYDAFEVGDPWGPAWATTWFHLTGDVSSDLAHPELLVDLGFSGSSAGFQCEGLVLRPDGRHVKALNPLNDWVSVAPGERVDLYVEAAANPHVLTSWHPTQLGDKLSSGTDPVYRLAAAAVVEVEPNVRELLADVEVLEQLADQLGQDDARQVEILLALEKALDALDLTDVARTAAAARSELAPALARPAYDGAHRVSAIGHAHIDSAWLWPVRETVRKVARTVSNVVNLLDEGRDHQQGLVYAMSSAQQWEWIRQYHPGLFARVQEHVRRGRFVPVGGMWVESDTNMVGGEAMARQFLVGQRWFEEHLGVICEEVWLPDSFGYTAALPQIVTSAGCRWFLTQKISWNTTNAFPHHTFWWEGIDGTRVFTHFPPVDTYTAQLTGRELAHAARNFRDKGAATRSLVPFGHGDGGGGPTREMLGRARRTAGLAGSPVVAVETPREFFEAAEEEYAGSSSGAPVWAGELYLEIHRGTYTSQAAMKQGNRRSEHLLREAELWSATAAVRGLLDYPAVDLDELWRIVLLHQFHDILPGSSIAWVHREARATYADVAARLEAIVDRALAALAGDGDDEVAFNAGPVDRNGVPALGVGFATVAGATSSTSDGSSLQNNYLRVELDDLGVIRRVFDKTHHREALPPGGAANLLQLHPDHPVKWDAWDLDRSYRSSVTDLVGGRVWVEGDAIMVRHEFGESLATQRIWLDDNLLTCETEIDWHEREKVLKAAFDVDVHTDHAAYETQFGHVVRPTHENTTWDAARFEVCAHRWVRVADAGYAVAIANDSTYGHDVTRHPRRGGGTYSRVRLSLLRAPLFPDPRTDQGRHVFRYALVPGAGIADAAEAGYALNLPLRHRSGSPVEPLVRVDGTAYVEAVKLAADGSGDVVVRLYEPLGARTQVRVTASFEHTSVHEVDILERPHDSGAWDGTRLLLRPFQIVTLRWSRRAR